MAVTPTNSERPLRRDAERNRQRILEAARAAFAEDGLSVTLDEIARRAGVGVGTIYRRFPDKEQLIDALFEERMNETAAEAEAALHRRRPVGGARALPRDAPPSSTPATAASRRSRCRACTAASASRAPASSCSRSSPGSSPAPRPTAACAPTSRPTDMPLLQLMLGSLSECTREADPEAWRRYLGIICDGLRTRRDEPTPLEHSALSPEQTQTTMRTWRPCAR